MTDPTLRIRYTLALAGRTRTQADVRTLDLNGTLAEVPGRLPTGAYVLFIDDLAVGETVHWTRWGRLPSGPGPGGEVDPAGPAGQPPAAAEVRSEIPIYFDELAYVLRACARLRPAECTPADLRRLMAEHLADTLPRLTEKVLAFDGPQLMALSAFVLQALVGMAGGDPRPTATPGPDPPARSIAPGNRG